MLWIVSASISAVFRSGIPFGKKVVPAFASTPSNASTDSIHRSHLPHPPSPPRFQAVSASSAPRSFELKNIRCRPDEHASPGDSTSCLIICRQPREDYTSVGRSVGISSAVASPLLQPSHGAVHPCCAMRSLDTNNERKLKTQKLKHKQTPK
jgi:hypothetical protein